MSLALFLAGCQSAGFPIGGFPTPAASMSALQNRAGFELECEELETTVLDSYDGWPRQVAIEACERRAVYVMSPSGWVGSRRGELSPPEATDAGGEESTSNPRDPQIEVTFSGECSPTFDARRMVTTGGGTVSVISSSLGGVTGSIMLGLGGAEGTVELSTQQRIDTQMAINVMQGQRLWTNMTIDLEGVRSNRIPDAISGSITLAEYDSDAANIDVTFTDVSLQSMSDGTICTLNGRLRTRGVTYGQ